MDRQYDFDDEMPDWEQEKEEMERVRGCWLEMELANHVGFKMTLRNYEGDAAVGRIVGIRDGGVLLVDDKKNRIFCSIECISFYCIYEKTKKKASVRKRKK